jgi:hypothetical protein
MDVAPLHVSGDGANCGVEVRDVLPGVSTLSGMQAHKAQISKGSEYGQHNARLIMSYC